MKYAYPRLDNVAALALLGEYSGSAPAELIERAAIGHSRVQWYPTARIRADEDRLEMVQKVVRETAGRHGYPTDLGTRSQRYIDFDREIGPLLYTSMEIVPADAASEGVWSFLALVLLPDVSLWRFPNRDLREDYDRIIGRNRHVFGRLWWRCHALGPDPEGPGSQLGEDEAVNIFERPTLGGDPRIASAIVREFVSRVTAGQRRRSELMRDATKRLRRLTSILTIGALPDSELDAVVAEAFEASAAALERHGGEERG